MIAVASTIRIRMMQDHVDVVSLPDARLGVFAAAVPWREFRWYRKQRHFSGSYWSATMQASVDTAEAVVKAATCSASRPSAASTCS